MFASSVRRVVVLADTHVVLGGKRQLPEAVRRALDEVSMVLHAGDIVDPAFLAQLRTTHTVHAVLGNNDHELTNVLPRRLTIDIDGVGIGMVHDCGGTASRAARAKRWFPEARVVIFGHSHMPCNVWHDDQLLFNPGSSTWKRRAPEPTFGMLTFADSQLVAHDVLAC